MTSSPCFRAASGLLPSPTCSTTTKTRYTQTMSAPDVAPPASDPLQVLHQRLLARYKDELRAARGTGPVYLIELEMTADSIEACALALREALDERPLRESHRPYWHQRYLPLLRVATRRASHARLSVPGHGHRVLAGAGAAAGRRDPAAGLRGAATPLRRVRRLVRAQDPRHALGAPLTNRGAQPSRGRSRTRSCRASCTRRCWRRCSPRTPGASGRTPGR